jgi:DeoR/GlpR family transcriptional regulator of sugar metabolism
LIPAERRNQIAEIVSQEGQLSVTEISDLFGVSEMTARRDLRDLDQKGLVRRVHGGAVSRLGRSYEPPYPTRMQENQSKKRRIGQAAAALVVDGDSLAFDVGTTTLEVARHLQGRQNLTIVTASLPIANELVSLFSLEDEIRLILTGGVLRARELSMIGDLARRAYTDLHVDKAFIGVGGISVDSGLTEYNIEDATTKTPLLKSAKQKIVVADSSKLGRTTLSRIGGLDEIDLLVTDANADPTMVRQIEGAGVKVRIAGGD